MLLCVACCLVFVVCCVLFVVCCVLFVVCCLLFVCCVVVLPCRFLGCMAAQAESRMSPKSVANRQVLSGVIDKGPGTLSVGLSRI